MVFNKIKAEAFNYKIELLFCIELLLSFLPIQVFFKFCLMITFFLLLLKMWLRWLFAIFFVIFFLLVNYSVFIVDKDIRSREKITFYTVSGTVKGDYLEVGDVVVGIFECKKESFFEECTLKREFFKMRVPFYSYLMKFRNERVNQLYYGSGKKVTLIQAMFYGDRSFLSNEVKE
ncbi:MAG: hypothetical protein N3C60_05755, partial [Calditerrivibrio sp.]|nr:hypothetical protein [Calditerrivibrio sp.]